MKKLLAATAALGLAITAVPATADDHMDGDMMEMTDMQQSMYDGWSAENQATYDAWPMEAQTYFWTLNDSQKNTWWTLLNNEQRVRIVGMTPQQRTAAWNSINAQVNGTATAPAATAGATNASTTATTRGNVQFVSNEMAQATPAGYRSTANASDLPVCSANQQDGCINSWEKNRTGTRPLNYWPGRPASEM